MTHPTLAVRASPTSAPRAAPLCHNRRLPAQIAQRRDLVCEIGSGRFHDPAIDYDVRTRGSRDACRRDVAGISEGSQLGGGDCASGYRMHSIGRLSVAASRIRNEHVNENRNDDGGEEIAPCDADVSSHLRLSDESRSDVPSATVTASLRQTATDQTKPKSIVIVVRSDQVKWGGSATTLDRPLASDKMLGITEGSIKGRRKLSRYGRQVQGSGLLHSGHWGEGEGREGKVLDVGLCDARDGTQLQAS